MVQSVESKSEFDQILKENASVVVDFYADWCGPCKVISPKFVEITKEYPKTIKFLKVNVDTLPGVAQQFGIMSIPTFIRFEKGEAVDRFSGADVNRLTEMVSQANEIG